MTLIDVPISQDGFEKVYKEKIMDDVSNEREVIVKVHLQSGGNMEKKRLNLEKL
jgi:hypothetical protein